MKAVAHIKLDQDVKQQAQQLAEDLGLSLSTLINAQLKQAVRQKRVVLSTKSAYEIISEKLKKYF